MQLIKLLAIILIVPTFFFSHLVFADNLQTDASLKEIKIDDNTFSRKDSIPSWVDQVEIPNTHKNNPIVIRLADTQFNLDTIKQVYVNRVIQINDTASLSQAGQIPINFNPAYEKLHLFAVRIYRGSLVLDQTDTINVRFLQREQGLENGVYSGTITAMLLVSDLRVGDSIQYTYLTEGSNPVFGKVYTDAASWDQPDPIELRRVVLSYPLNRKINWRFIGDLQDLSINPKTTTKNGQKKLIFEAKDLKGIDFEQFTPSNYISYRRLHFSEYDNWQQVAAWAKNLFPKPATLSPEIKSLVEKAKKLPNDEARVLFMLHWVQSEIRYFSLFSWRKFTSSLSADRSSRAPFW
jgi:Domain of Unknown Function with PDB structure (DUF3857)